MPDRLTVAKTYKLFINGKFPRSESGRALPLLDAKGNTLAHTSHASRKDLRDAVEAARAALPGWSGATAYLRGQILYRMAEMLEGKADEFADLLRQVPIAAAATEARAQALDNASPKSRTGAARAAPSVKRRTTPAKPARPAHLTPAQARREVRASVDRLVCFAGWTGKYAQVLGCNNPVAGPYYNFTVPQPTGVVAAIAPDGPALLGLVSLIAPVLCAGNTVVALASEANPLPAAVLGEVCATSDLPAGVVNLLTGRRGELLEHIAAHREINAALAGGLSPDEARTLHAGAAENLKRITTLEDPDFYNDAERHSPWTIEPFVELKTIWHPSAT
jgi:acyl-CoA reductase-like NAD-dependent aldehyde dehydrogenase